jgi:hypothetical protein
MGKKRYVSDRPIGGNRDNAGTGFIIIPRDVDKQKFIEFCYRTGTVSLLLENGGVIDQVLITREALQDIEWPESFKTKGSQLVWINQPRKNQPIAIGRISLTNEFVNFNKGKGSLRRVSKNFVSEVFVDAEKGTVIVTSNSSVEGGGDIYIISTNKDKTSKLHVRVSGDVNVSSSNFNLVNSDTFSLTIKDTDEDEEVTEIKYKKGVGLSYKDEFKNEIIINEEGVKISPHSSFKIKEGSQPMVLGDKLFDQQNEFIDLVIRLSAQCAAMAGALGLPNAAEFTTISQQLATTKGKFPTFKSETSFTD